MHEDMISTPYFDFVKGIMCVDIDAHGLTFQILTDKINKDDFILSDAGKTVLSHINASVVRQERNKSQIPLQMPKHITVDRPTEILLTIASEINDDDLFLTPEARVALSQINAAVARQVRREKEG
jgi:sRNA-binding carbon storage regulator CsrA